VEQLFNLSYFVLRPSDLNLVPSSHEVDPKGLLHHLQVLILGAKQAPGVVLVLYRIIPLNLYYICGFIVMGQGP